MIRQRTQKRGWDPGAFSPFESEDARTVRDLVNSLWKSINRSVPLGHVNTEAEIIESIIDSANQLELPVDGVNIHLQDRPRTLRLAADVSRQLARRGVILQGLDDFAGQPEWEAVDVNELAQRLGKNVEEIWNVTSKSATKAIASRLEHIARFGPGLKYEDHESEGMLPIAANMADVREILDRIRGPREHVSRPPRHVNSAFFSESENGALRELPQATTRLRSGELVHFGVQIVEEKDALTVSLGSTAIVEEILRSPAGTWIEIGVTAIDFDLVGDPCQRLWLPADEPTDLVTFAVTPRKTKSGIARLRFSIFRDNNVVQSFLVAAVLDHAKGDVTRQLAHALNVTGADVRSVGKVGYLPRPEYAATAIKDTSSVAPRALTILANQSGGEKIVTVKGEELFSVTIDPNLPIKVQRARDALSRISRDGSMLYRYRYQGQPNTGNPDELRDLMWEVASAGWSVYSLLVRGDDEQKKVRERLERGGGIRAAHIDATSVIPWSLIYDRPVRKRKKISEDVTNPKALQYDVTHAWCTASKPNVDGTMPEIECGGLGCLLHPSENLRRKAAGEELVVEETVICPRRFWGFMFPIEVPAQQITGIAGQTPPPVKEKIDAAQPVKVVAGFNPTLSFVTNHETELNEIFGAQATLVRPAIGGSDAIVDVLAKADPDIVYFYCHALGTVTTKGATVGPVLDFGRGEQGVFDEILQAEDFRGSDWSHAPLVFMNGCGNTGFNPYAPSELIKQFIQARKASAVVGTEVTVWEVLAREVARLFLESFLDRKTAGASLLRTRRALLAKANPLGLIYTLYGSAQLTIANKP